MNPYATALAVLVILPLSACFPWGSRAPNRVPKQTALERTYTPEGSVIVVGAGAAGLAAARVFEDNGVDYTVLEATEYSGGRLREAPDFADFPLDLGAEWIHNRAEILDVLSGVPGTAASTELIPYRLEETLVWDGEQMADAQPYFDRLARFFPEFKFKHSTWAEFAQEHYGRRVEHRIQYGVEVKEIDHSGDRVKLTTTDGAVHEADRVLVTVSIGVLRSGGVSFNPPLSDKKRSAIEAVPFLHGFKALLKFTEDFYPDAVFSNVSEGEMGFYDAAFKKDRNDPVLGALVVGPSADVYYALDSEKAMADALIDELDRMFDGQASQHYTGEFLLIDWGRDPQFLGTWVEGFRLSKRTVKALNEPLDGQVFFAGEAYDTYHQLGVPGAILSGLNAADRILTEER